MRRFLENNVITSIADGVFRDTPNLYTFYAKFNKLTVLGRWGFGHRLRYMNLQNNQIKVIKSGGLTDAYHLSVTFALYAVTNLN